MMPSQPDFAESLKNRLPPVLKWCFAAMGGAAGWYYARSDASPIPFSYIALGAVAGFLLVASLVISYRLLKMLCGVGVGLLLLNYVLLIPFGYGDHLHIWLDAGRSALRWLNTAPLAARWGKLREDRPHARPPFQPSSGPSRSRPL